MPSTLGNPSKYMYFQFRKDFDYIQYLEEKSHFDRVEFAVSSGIKDITTSNAELSKLHMETTSQLNDSVEQVGADVRALGTDIREGFEKISVSLTEVSVSIDNLSTICENGFAQLDLGLNNLNQTLEQLVAIARTPDQTWALEQYSIASDAFRKNFIEEAYDYINRAINGYSDNSGYRLEHRFYILRGLIRLGNYKNHSSEFVSPKVATEDFILAAKYAAHDNKIDCARSFSLAGWASYCDGRIEDAEAHYRRSLEFNNKDARSVFELSKVLFHQKKKEEALLLFSEALHVDINFALRAGADPDFLEFDAEIENCINNYRDELRHDLSSFLQQYNKLKLDQKSQILSKHGMKVDTPSKLFFEAVKVEIGTAPLADLSNMKSAAKQNLDTLFDSLKHAVHDIQMKIKDIRSDIKRRTSLRDFPRATEISIDGVERGYITSLVAFPVGLAFYFANRAKYMDAGFVAFFVTAIAFAIAYPVVGYYLRAREKSKTFSEDTRILNLRDADIKSLSNDIALLEL